MTSVNGGQTSLHTSNFTTSVKFFNYPNADESNSQTSSSDNTQALAAQKLCAAEKTDHDVSNLSRGKAVVDKIESDTRPDLNIDSNSSANAELIGEITIKTGGSSEPEEALQNPVDDAKDTKDHIDSAETISSESATSPKESKAHVRVKKEKKLSELANGHSSEEKPPVQVNQTPFIQKLYSMLEDHKLDQVISWSPTNDSFFINPAEEFSQILCLYFKHTNIASFVRQLSMYGFHKVNQHSRESSRYRCKSDEATSIASSFSWEFKHCDGRFRRNDFPALRSIKRRSSRRTNRDKKVERHVMVPSQDQHFSQQHSRASNQNHTVLQDQGDQHSGRWFSPVPVTPATHPPNHHSSAPPGVSQNQPFSMPSPYSLLVGQAITNGRDETCLGTPSGTASKSDMLTRPLERTITNSPLPLADQRSSSVPNVPKIPQHQNSAPSAPLAPIALHNTEPNGNSVSNWIQQRSHNYMVYPEMSHRTYNQVNQPQRPQLPHPIHDVASGELASRVLAKQRQLESEISTLQQKLGTLSQSAGELGLLVHLLSNSGQNNAVQSNPPLSSISEQMLGNTAQPQLSKCPANGQIHHPGLDCQSPLPVAQAGNPQLSFSAHSSHSPHSDHLQKDNLKVNSAPYFPPHSMSAHQKESTCSLPYPNPRSPHHSQQNGYSSTLQTPINILGSVAVDLSTCQGGSSLSTGAPMSSYTPQPGIVPSVKRESDQGSGESSQSMGDSNGDSNGDSSEDNIAADDDNGKLDRKSSRMSSNESSDQQSSSSSVTKNTDSSSSVTDLSEPQTVSLKRQHPMDDSVKAIFSKSKDRVRLKSLLN